MTNVVDRALQFATEAHKNTFRKGTKLPYILHPMEAAVIVASLTDNQAVIAGALLHDVLEDTPVTAEQIEAEFGKEILQLVLAESEDKREDLPAEQTWKLRKQETIDHMKTSATTEQKMIAFGDKLSNLRAIHRDYHSLGDALWNRFNQKDPKQHGWYYGSFLETCKEFVGTQAYAEYERLYQEVFGNL